MWFISDVETRYPECTRFAKAQLQLDFLKTRKPQVFNAFEKACESERFAREALTWGLGPEVAPGSGVLASSTVRGCGVNTLAKTIAIESLLFAAFESGYNRTLAKLHLEATILHELVHWARDKAGVNSLLWTDDALYEGEAGRVFESWAYGRLFCTIEDVAHLKAAVAQANRQRIFDGVTQAIKESGL